MSAAKASDDSAWIPEEPGQTARIIAGSRPAASRYSRKAEGAPLLGLIRLELPGFAGVQLPYHIGPVQSLTGKRNGALLSRAFELMQWMPPLPGIA